MNLIDLHVHSTASDGSLSPSEVVDLAAKKGLTAIALTDHATASGVPEALRKRSELLADHKDAPEVIPGIEISSLYRETEIHILGLYIDHNSEALLSFLDGAAKRRLERNMKILDAFQKDGFDITLEDLQCGNPDTVITRAHFARALLKHGYVSSVDQAFKKYLDSGKPYYRKRVLASPEEVLSVILKAGGFPVLAHPLLYKFGWNVTEELISSLKSLGLMGLECFHSSNNQSESGKLRALALKYDLLPTGGSDFHGAAKPDIDIGSGRGGLRIPALLLDDIKLARSR